MIDSYDKLTIGKYRELIKLEKEDDMTYGLQILSVLSDISEDDLMNMPLDEFSSMMAKTKFLYKEIEKLDYNHLGKTLTINGKKYEIIKSARKMTAGQYIDYKNYISNENLMDVLPYIMTVFVIPKGHKYCDDYDAEDLANEFNEYMDIKTALCISDFFRHQSALWIQSSMLYLEWTMKRTLKREKNQEMKEKLTEALNQIAYLRNSLKNLDGYMQP